MLVSSVGMDRHADAFFTDEELANFAEHFSEQGLRIYIGPSSSSSSKSSLVHPALKELVSDELNLQDATSASIVPMASGLAAMREEEEARRELGSFRVTLPYVHDENRYHQMMMNSADDDDDDDDDDDREQVVETTEEIAAHQESNNNCCELNESVESCTSSEVDSDSNNEHDVDDSNEVNNEEVHKTLSDNSSEDDGRDNDEEEKNDLQTELQSNDLGVTVKHGVQKQTSKAPRKRSSYSNINAGIVAQREKIRDICNNRQRSSKKKEQVRRGNYFKEVRQKCGDDDSSEEEEEQSYEKQAEHPRQQQEEVDEKGESEGSASEGFLDTEDEQSDDLVEFETQTELPIARKRKSTSLSAKAIGNSIAKAATGGGGDDSQWIGRITKRRSKLKRPTKRVSLDTSSSNKASAANNQNSKATQLCRRRTVGFGAAPGVINKRKTQLSLLRMLKK